MIRIDMPMPKCCANCYFASADLVGGIITLSCMTPIGRQMYAPDLINRKDRPEWCPLKEQEAVKPTWGRGKPFCGACGLRIHGGKFCSECGKPIAWEGR